MSRLIHHAKRLRTEMTDAERKLWQELRAHRFQDWKFRRQQPIGPYIVDFVCFAAAVIIEADGGQHADCANDHVRDAWLKREGFTVLRFWNNQVLRQLPEVLEDIERTMRRHTLSPAPLPSRERGSKATGRESDGERGRNAELRLYGLNAVRAMFAARPQALRKLYLSEARIPALQPLLAWCVANRVGYRVVAEADLGKLAASSHHEGVVADVLRAEPAPLVEWLRGLPAGPQCAIWLDGVGNPHNLGAILRSAAHFGVAAVLLPQHSILALSGAAARVAEGGAEAVPMVRLSADDDAMAQLHGAGFVLAATVVDGGQDLFATAPPERVAYVLGAEGEGMDRDLAARCDLRLSIPGSGAVESLNVAAATAVLLASWRRQR